jgi:hypothetical protein
LLAAWYTDDRTRVHWFDPAMKALQENLDRAVGKRQASIVSRSLRPNLRASEKLSAKRSFDMTAADRIPQINRNTHSKLVNRASQR